MSTNKVWYHAGAPCNGCGGLGEMWRRLDAAGIPFGVYSVEGGGLVAEAAAFGQADPLIYRSLATDVAAYELSPDAAAARSWARLMEKLPAEVKALRGRVWIEIGNEQDKGRADWLGWYYVALAGHAAAEGYRICGPGWATGEPEAQQWATPGWLAYLRLCAARPDRLAVTVHEYSLDADDIMTGYPWLAGRVSFLFDLCAANGIRPPVVFVTEAGWTHNDLPPADKAKEDIDALARLYAQYPTVKAAFLWSLIGGGDKKTLAAELNGLMPWLTEYAVGTRFPDADEEDGGDEGGNVVSNLLVNPSFEGEWEDADDFPGQHPRGWRVEWNAGAGFPNPRAAEWAYQVGEGVHKSKGMLPAAERDVFVWDGEWTYKLFAGQKAFWARLKQAVALPAGRYRLVTAVWVDCYRWSGFKDYNVEPWQAETMVRVNGATAREWSLMVSGGRRAVATEFEHGGGAAELAVHFRCNWPISNNLWLDGWSLEAVTVDEPPPPPPPPVNAPGLILDVSKWQGTLDPVKMKAAGVDGVMLRASYAGAGGSRPDEKVDEFAPLLKAAGIPYGLYHYFHPARLVAEQLGVFRGVVEKHGYGLRLALDLEETAGLDSATAAKAAIFAASMRDEFPLPQGKRHLIYTSLGYWRDKLGSPAWGGEYELWIAAWTQAAAPIVPNPWTRWTVWQHTSDGDGPEHGVGSARVDLNRFNGTAAEFAAWQAAGAGQSFPAALWADSLKRTEWGWNPAAALAKKILADGFIPTGYEIRLEHGGVVWFYQIAHNGPRTARRVYYVEKDKWGTVKWLGSPDGAAPVVVESAIDLLPYVRGDGRLYEVRHPSGSTETFQTQSDGDMFYLVKNSQWEQLYADNDYIWRGVDTSPGDGRFYVQYEPLLKRARWTKRRMRVGETWVGPGHTVQFYDKATCARSAANSGNATNRMTLVGRHESKTWNGVDVVDVVEMTNGSERWFYGRGLGLVAWVSAWGQSAIWRLYAPGERGNLVREKLACQY